MVFSSIPVIDIGGLLTDAACSPDRQRHAIAQEIRQACHQVGFFYIANHGIPEELITRTFAAAKQFFDQPLQVKNQVAIAQSAISRGFEPIASQVLDPNAAPDWKEGYYIGVERSLEDPLVQAGTPNHGPNQWPTHLPGWREQMQDYFSAMMTLSRRLLQGIALSLELDPTYFEPLVDNPMAILRLLHYPPHPADATVNQLGCGCHTDWGCLTILLQDSVGGLEVCTSDGQWVQAEPIPGTFVINLGDMMARWTNDYYQSTPHRVMNRTNRERYSIPFFFDANYHALIECLPSCQSPEHPPKYQPITAGEHILQMYQTTYAGKSPEPQPCL